MIEERYFHAIYQHFAEGLFDKDLSMDQAKRLAILIMNHVPQAQKQPVMLNAGQKQLDTGQKELEYETETSI